MKLCGFCLKEIQQSQEGQLYCNAKCNRQAYVKRRAEKQKQILSTDSATAVEEETSTTTVLLNTIPAATTASTTTTTTVLLNTIPTATTAPTTTTTTVLLNTIPAATTAPATTTTTAVSLTTSPPMNDDALAKAPSLQLPSFQAPPPKVGPLPTGRKANKFKLLTPEELQELMKEATNDSASSSASVLRHQKSAKGCFEIFLNSVGRSLEEVQKMANEDLTNHLKMWVVASLKDNGKGSNYNPMYYLDSFRDTYVRHLLGWLAMKNIITKEQKTVLQKILKEKVTEMVRSGKVSQAQRKQKGKPPALPADLEYLLATTPTGYLQEYEDVFGLLSTAMFTGQRNITLANVKWKSILTFKALNEEGDCEYELEYDRGKGIYSWGHKQALEGNFKKHGINPAFWLEQLWKLANKDPNATLVGTDLQNHKLSNEWIFGNKKLGKDQVFREQEVGNYYRTKLNGIAHYCGYTSWYFGNHSFRSGMQVASYINLVTSGKNSSDAWSMISLYIGYPPKATHQMEYFRNQFRGVLVLSRALDPKTMVKMGGSVMAQHKITPESFHSIKLFPKWRLEDNWRGVVKRLSVWIQKELPEQDRGLQALQMRVEKEIIGTIFQEQKYQDRLEVARERVLEDSKKRGASERKSRLDKQALLLVLAQECEQKFKSTGTPTWAILEKILGENKIAEQIPAFRELYIPRGPLKKPRKVSGKRNKGGYRSLKASAKEEKAKRVEKERIQWQQEVQDRKRKLEEAQQTEKPKRNKWTDNETEVLLTEYLKTPGVWAQICKNLPGRSNVNCKDRVRTIHSQEEGETEIESAKKWLKRLREDQEENEEEEVEESREENEENDQEEGE